LAKIASLNGHWTVPDKQGRRPIDLGGESTASFIPVEEDKPSPKPAPITWDHDVDWKRVNKTKTRIFIRTNDLEDLNESDWEMARGELPFYPNQSIIRLKLRENPEGKLVLYFLEAGENLFRLNGTSPPVHEFNASHLQLTRENALQYLHFFCFFVRGEDGPFYVYENPKEAYLNSKITDEDRNKINSLAMPSWEIGFEKDSYYYLSRVFYSNALFNSYFKVMTSGMIEMEDDMPILADLSGSVDMPVA